MPSQGSLYYKDAEGAPLPTIPCFEDYSANPLFAIRGFMELYKHWKEAQPSKRYAPNTFNEHMLIKSFEEGLKVVTGHADDGDFCILKFPDDFSPECGKAPWPKLPSTALYKENPPSAIAMFLGQLRAWKGTQAGKWPVGLTYERQAQKGFAEAARTYAPEGEEKPVADGEQAAQQAERNPRRERDEVSSE